MIVIVVWLEPLVICWFVSGVVVVVVVVVAVVVVVVAVVVDCRCC